MSANNFEKVNISVMIAGIDSNFRSSFAAAPLTITEPANERPKEGKSMKNARSLIGLPIVMESRELGHVSAVVLDDSLRSLSGIYFICGLAGSRRIERSELDLIGDVAVLVHGTGKKSQPPPPPLPRRALSPDGSRLGAITDAIIDEETFTIPMLELSNGYLDDLTQGRTRVGAFSVAQNGDVIIDVPKGEERS